MHPSLRRHSIAPTTASASAVATLFADEVVYDAPLVSIPRAEIHVAVRFGPPSHGGRIDVHALGGRETVHRKVLRAGQRAVSARLRLGAAEAVLGVPASAVAGRIVALEDLWGETATRRLLERLAAADGTDDAAAILDHALAGRATAAAEPRPHVSLAIAAAERLPFSPVNAVAEALGVSERHLRRVFRDVVGMSPKAFARLARFRRAVDAARRARGPDWARIAAATGYYDQAHLIDEFRAIAGVTPRVLLGEIGG